jgi:hypothetical protein
MLPEHSEVVDDEIIDEPGRVRAESVHEQRRPARSLVMIDNEHCTFLFPHMAESSLRSARTD